MTTSGSSVPLPKRLVVLDFIGTYTTPPGFGPLYGQQAGIMEKESHLRVAWVTQAPADGEASLGYQRRS